MPTHRRCIRNCGIFSFRVLPNFFFFYPSKFTVNFVHTWVGTWRSSAYLLDVFPWWFTRRLLDYCIFSSPVVISYAVPYNHRVVVARERRLKATGSPQWYRVITAWDRTRMLNNNTIINHISRVVNDVEMFFRW